MYYEIKWSVNYISEDVYGQFLRFSVTESAANTFTEGSAIYTGASVRSVQGKALCLEVHQIVGDLTLPEDIPATTASEFNWGGVSTRSGLTAIPSIDEDHVIYSTEISITGGVATYVPLVRDTNRHMPQVTNFPKPILVSHTKLFPYVESSNSSATSIFAGYIFFNYVLLDGALAIEALETFR